MGTVSRIGSRLGRVESAVADRQGQLSAARVRAVLAGLDPRDPATRAAVDGLLARVRAGIRTLESGGRS